MADYEKIKRELEKKLAELTTRAEEIEDDMGQPADDDWEERATEMADDEVLLAVGSATLQEIREIKLALSRLESGDYGVCVRCGSDIAAGRLEVLPYTTTCIQCSGAGSRARR